MRPRLKSVTGWREVEYDAWQTAGIALSIEPLLPDRAPPWGVAACPHMSFGLDIGTSRRDTTAEELRRAA